MDMLAYIDQKYPEIGKRLNEKKVINDELKKNLRSSKKQFKEGKQV